jgi:hypothetical protein
LNFLNIGFQGNNEDTSLPSWVPDVLCPTETGVHPVLFGFTATGDSALGAPLSQNKKVLTIVGKINDEVMVLSQPLGILQKDISRQQKAKVDTR